jgi:ribosomal protein S18 acetylase RimI-like enzyme
MTARKAYAPPNQQDDDWLARVEVRQVKKSDLRALEWEGAYKRFRRIYADVFQRTQFGQAVMWVADLPGYGLVGQVFVQLNSDHRPELANGKTRAYVHAFRVRPLFRNAGLGTLLMQTAEADLLARHYQTVILAVAKDNPAARRLYERLGYEVFANDSGRWSYRDDRGMLQHVVEPGWRMRKDLRVDTR